MNKFIYATNKSRELLKLALDQIEHPNGYSRRLATVFDGLDCTIVTLLLHYENQLLLTRNTGSIFKNFSHFLLPKLVDLC